MGRIIGLDLGTSALKAVAIDASFRSHAVKECRVVAVPATPEGAEPEPWLVRAGRALATLAEGGFLRADKLICALPAAQVATHPLSLPYGDLKQVQKVLPGALEDLELEEVVFDSHVLTRTPQSTDLLVGIAREHDLRALLGLLSEHGIDPAIVTFSALALGNLHAEGYAKASDGLEILLDIGAENAQLLLRKDGELRLARTLSKGVAELARAVARAESITIEAADERLRTLPDEFASSPAMARGLAGLVREVRATIAAHFAQTKEQVQKLVLTGGGSRLNGIDTFLARSLGVEVTRLEPAPGRAFPAPDDWARTSLALALALRGLGGAKCEQLNFRQGAFATAAAAGSWRDRIGTFAAMAAVLIALMFASSWASLSALEKRETALDDALCEATKKILGTCETNYRAALGKLKGKGSPAAAVPAVSAVDLSVAMGDLFPPGDEAVLSELDIVDTTVSMRGDARSYEAVDKLVDSIQRNKCFTEIKKGNLTKGKNERIEFKLDALYTCGANKKART